MATVSLEIFSMGHHIPLEVDIDIFLRIELEKRMRWFSQGFLQAEGPHIVMQVDNVIIFFQS